MNKYLLVSFMYLSKKSFCFLSKKSISAKVHSPDSFIVGSRTDIGVLSVMGVLHKSLATVTPPSSVGHAKIE